jgi:hypothetical protein
VVATSAPAQSGAPEWMRAARVLYLVAIAVFVVNIVIGILNGSDAVEFDRNQILTHVHAGTVGWLTLVILAATTLLFRATDRRLTAALAIMVPVYVLAFYTGNFAFRAISGTILLLVIGWLLVWLWGQFLASERSLPKLSVTLGLTTFGVGAVLGVLLQIAFATGSSLLPGDGIGAHAASMTFGYLVLVAFGVLEWRFLGTPDRPRLGLVQVVALFAGGLILPIALLSGATQAGGGLYLLAGLVAVVLFAVRVLPKSLRVSWLTANPIRHLAAATLWIIVAMAIFLYVVFTAVAANDPSAPLPFNLIVASDHAVYIGVVTNGAIGLLSVLFLRETERSGWFGHLVFWGINLGLAVFAVGLILESAELKRIGAPVMGIVLLLALGLIFVRLWQAREPELEAAAAKVAPPA